MVLCKFFLEGRCRYGEGCRFEHTVANRPTNTFQQQSFNQQQPRQYFQQQQQRVGDSHNEINIDNLLYVVKDDATNSVEGGQWLLSCYAPQIRKFAKISKNPNEENLPGLTDYSPEELRWEAITSNMTGQFHDYTTKLQHLAQSYHAIQRALQNLDPQTANFIVRYERGENVSPVGTLLGNTSPYLPTNNATAPSGPSQFSFKLPSAQLPQQPESAGTSFRFQIPAQQQQQPAAAPFTFQLPAQQNQPAVAPFHFKLPTQQQQPVTTATANTFSFQLPTQQFQSVNTSLLNNQSNQSTSSHPISSDPNESILHAQLSQSAIEQFKADKFSFGKIPRIPPPKELR